MSSSYRAACSLSCGRPALTRQLLGWLSERERDICVPISIERAVTTTVIRRDALRDRTSERARLSDAALLGVLLDIVRH